MLATENGRERTRGTTGYSESCFAWPTGNADTDGARRGLGVMQGLDPPPHVVNHESPEEPFAVVEDPRAATRETSAGAAAVEAPRLQPVGERQRVDAVDVLRGVALLGILVINIDFFALSSHVFLYPPAAGGFEGLNLLTWKFGSTLFLQKMMAIFSMLFGAGLILMYERAAAAGRPKLAGIWYRRMFWLLAFGMVHAYLLWYGDILVTYALCGLLIFLFRRRAPWLVITLGCLVLGFGMLLQLGMGWGVGIMRDHARAAEEALAAGETPTEIQAEMLEAWRATKTDLTVDDEKLQIEIDAYRGGYLDNLAHRVPETVMMQTTALFFFMLPRALGLMLIGMGLMKAGVFAAARSRAFYAWFVGIGYGVGIPLQYYGSEQLIAHDFDVVFTFREGMHYGGIGSVLVALGHVGLVMLIHKSGWLGWLTRRLAATGRMALTNYFLQTLICTTIFYGYGFGQFGRIERFGLIWIVFGVWILQLAISPLWLSRFLFGPLEWMWRSLTYWKRQPLLRTDRPGA